MGQMFQAKCRECGHEFRVRQGGGFTFHVVRCDNCGKTKSIGFEELGELHIRFLKGLTGPYSMATAELDDLARKLPSGPAITEEEYKAGVESVAGYCRCRGKYTLSAPPRCPTCGSTDFSEGNLMVCYD
jgi:predicted Zn-ribbon and HTH transcriptional regulator